MQGPWSDGVPDGWQIRPLWSEFRRCKTLGDGSEELLSVYRDYGVIPKSSREDNFNKPSEDLSKYQRVSVGDLVVNKMKAWQGSLGISNHDGIVSPAYFVYKATGAIERRFAHYLLRSKEYADHMAAISSGIRPNQWDLDPVQFAVTPLLVPPRAEQRAIADYLDRETAQIDAFIAKNEELIALLTERRSAATFRLVTGLDALDGDSKVVQADWFRTVPRTWEVAPLYTMAQTFAGGTPKSDADEYWTDSDNEGTEWISISDMRIVHAGLPHKGRRVATAGLEAAGLTPRTGPLVLFAMYASVGEVAMLQRPAVWNQAILGIRTNPALLNECYLYWSLLALRSQLGIYFRSNTQDNLNATQVRGLRLPVPPIREQGRIVEQLEETWASVGNAISTAQRGIDLARERRAAFISAAVTGKIDVGVVA